MDFFTIVGFYWVYLVHDDMTTMTERLPVRYTSTTLKISTN